MPISRAACSSVMPGSMPCSTLRRPCDVKVAANSKEASWSASLMARRPSAGFIRRSAAFNTAPLPPAIVRSVSAMKEGRSSAVSPKPGSPATERLPADGADALACLQAAIGKDVGQRLRTVSRLRRQREGLVEDALVRSVADLGITPAFIADEKLRLPTGNDDQQRLLEARVVAREIGDVGRMLAVAIDDEGVEAGFALRAPAAPRCAPRRLRAKRAASPSARRIREATRSSTRRPKRAW